MKKVSRLWARLCILLDAAAIALVLLIPLLDRPGLIGVGFAFLLGSFGIKFFVLRCPNCRKGGMAPQWSKNGTHHCPRCGALLEYDE